jgi:hypothetical protein
MSVCADAIRAANTNRYTHRNTNPLVGIGKSPPRNRTRCLTPASDSFRLSQSRPLNIGSANELVFGSNTSVDWNR